MSEGNILNLMFASSLFWGPKHTSCCFHREAVATFSPFSLQISENPVNLNFSPLAERASHKQSLLSSPSLLADWPIFDYLSLSLYFTKNNKKLLPSQIFYILLTSAPISMALLGNETSFQVITSKCSASAFPCHKMGDQREGL